MQGALLLYLLHPFHTHRPTARPGLATPDDPAYAAEIQPCRGAYQRLNAQESCASRHGLIVSFSNLPMMNINRNASWTDPSGIAVEDLGRMTAFLGDESWMTTVYREQLTLDGGEDLVKVASNREVAAAFRKRLRAVAGFREVPEPVPMRNSKNAIAYCLFFASRNATGSKIARQIVQKYANHVESY